MAAKKPRTSVYIDGFNLYYGALKGTPFKWLDLRALCQAYLPNNDIDHIKYFTARISARPNDPLQPARQQAYLRALSTIPVVDIIYGHYLSHKVKARLANPEPGKIHTLTSSRRKRRARTSTWQPTCCMTHILIVSTLLSSCPTTPTCWSPSNWQEANWVNQWAFSTHKRNPAAPSFLTWILSSRSAQAHWKLVNSLNRSATNMASSENRKTGRPEH